MKSVIAKYLQRYAETESAEASGLPIKEAEHAIVIPCYDENTEFVERLLNQEFSNDILPIIIINQPENQESCARNTALQAFFATNMDLRGKRKNLSLYADHKRQWLIVDRYTHEQRIPVKQGVGLARKIGCDIAVQLFSERKLRATWIYSTDADAHLPQGYLTLAATSDSSACVLPFQHMCDDSDVGHATQLYETALNYYVQGLQWAGSAYAFHTIGSTLALDTKAYCQVRGFPKRSAGEDFYLLNKLNKIRAVTAFDLRHEKSTAVTTIGLSARLSHRVPFGTGPAVAKICDRLNAGKNLDYYAIECFEQLHTWQTFLTTAWAEYKLEDCTAQQRSARLRAGFHTLSQPVQSALIALNIDEFVKHIKRQITTKCQFTQFCISWFDAFKTLKFMHHLQREFFPDIPLSQSLKTAPWIDTQEADIATPRAI